MGSYNEHVTFNERHVTFNERHVTCNERCVTFVQIWLQVGWEVRRTPEGHTYYVDNSKSIFDASKG